MKPKNYSIEKITKKTPSANNIHLGEAIRADPGQFFMVWIRGVDEIPISPSSLDPAILTVRKVGKATKKICNLNEGDKIGLRGPYGTSFEEIGNKTLLVAGGVGAAPLLPFAKKISENDLTIALGGINKKELLFEETFKELGNVLVSTEDGSKGYHGYITEALEEFDFNKFDSVYSCGPEPMMYKIFNRVKEKDIFAQFSLHRYIKCGIGLCGSCCIDPGGDRMCKEGPVMNKEELKGTEFGEYKRDSCGKKTDII